MGSKSKGVRREVNFSSAIKTLSEMMDEKFMQNTKHFSQALQSYKLRLEAAEDLLMEKFGETEYSLKERVLNRIEKNQGFEEVSTEAAVGSPVRIKLKEEVVGKESEQGELQDAFMSVGQNQVHEAIDKLVVGMKPGETRDVVVPDPDNAETQRRITVTLVRVFKGAPLPAPDSPK